MKPTISHLFGSLVIVSFSADAAEITVTNTNASGANSLRDAVIAANPGDNIVFLPVLDGQSISLGGQQLAINKQVTIDASALSRGITLTADGLSRVLSTSANPNQLSVSGAIPSQTSQSIGHPANNAIDGNPSTYSETTSNDFAPALTVTFPTNRLLGSISIHNRGDGLFQHRLQNIQVTLLDENDNKLWVSPLLNPQNSLGFFTGLVSPPIQVAFPPQEVRKVTISKKVIGGFVTDENLLAIGELDFFAPGVVLNNVTVSGGQSSIGGEDGGNGGGIFNTGALSLVNSRVTGNRAGSGIGGEAEGSQGANGELIGSNGGAGGQGGSGANGGGIYNGFSGLLAIHNSTLQRNLTGAGTAGGNGGKGGDAGGEGSEGGAGGTGGAGGFGGAGGAIYNDGIVYLSNSTLAHNQTGDGGQPGNGGQGGGANFGGRGGSGGTGGSGGAGGAIFNQGFLSVTSTTIAHNKTGRGQNAGQSGTSGTGNNSPGPSAIEGAGGNGGDGGGIAQAGNLSAQSSTIAQNSTGLAGAGGEGPINNGSDGFPGRGGGLSHFSGTFLANSIIAHNSAFGGGSDLFSGGKGIPNLAGNNILTNLDGSFLTGGEGLTVADPNLRSLGEHGGPTHTMPPAHPSSPAIELADSFEVPTPSLDQRGFSRVNNSDVGAVEFQGANAETFFSFQLDSDQDGVSNGVELAIGTNPYLSDLEDEAHLELKQTPAGLQLSWTYADTSIDLQVMSSTDLINFQPVLSSFNDFPEAGSYIVDEASFFPAGKVFFRLEASLTN